MSGRALHQKVAVAHFAPKGGGDGVEGRDVNFNRGDKLGLESGVGLLGVAFADASAASVSVVEKVRAGRPRRPVSEDHGSSDVSLFVSPSPSPFGTSR